MTVLGLSNHADIWELEVWEFGGIRGVWFCPEAGLWEGVRCCREEMYVKAGRGTVAGNAAK